MKSVFFQFLLITSFVSLIFQSANGEGNAASVVTPKKGIAAARFGPGNIAQAHASWYYNWRSTPTRGTVPAGLQEPEYVPMLSRSGDVNDDNINRLREAANSGTYRYLLGFNEPDISGQANMSVAQVVSLWPRLEETGLILGSPAPSWNNNWFRDFMRQAEENGLRVDFICLHFYRSPTASGPVEELENFLTDAYEEYQKPIWLTEFGAPDCNRLGWCGSAPPLNQAATDPYIDEVIAMLEDHPYVERYAWFVDASQFGFEYSAIFDDEGSLSQTGTVFRDAHGSLPTRPRLNDAAVSGVPAIRQADEWIIFQLPTRQADYRISILDMAGRRLFSYQGAGAGEVTLNPVHEGFAQGVYVGKLESGGRTAYGRFVVK